MQSTELVISRALVHETPWQSVVAAYLDSAIDSPNTRRAYRRHLEAAFALLGYQTVAEVAGADLAAYRGAVTRSELAPASQAQALAAMRAFLKWAGTMGAHALPTAVIAEALRTPRATVQRPYNVLSDGEISRMMAVAASIRDKAILAVLLGAGLRVSEVVALDVDDFREDGEGAFLLYVRQGKGRKDRVVPVLDDVARILRAYLSDGKRRMGAAGPLFRAHDRGSATRRESRLTARSVAYVVASCAAAANIDAKAISPHSLRHTYALRSLRGSGNVVAVSKLLGHASIQTTQRYLDHLALSELRGAVAPLPA